MGKQKWRRVGLRDLADREMQQRVLGVLDQAKGQAEGDAPGKQPPEMAIEPLLKEQPHC